MKKIVALLLALVMVFSLSTVAFADEQPSYYPGMFLTRAAYNLFMAGATTVGGTAYVVAKTVASATEMYNNGVDRAADVAGFAASVPGNVNSIVTDFNANAAKTVRDALDALDVACKGELTVSGIGTFANHDDFTNHPDVDDGWDNTQLSGIARYAAVYAVLKHANTLVGDIKEIGGAITNAIDTNYTGKFLWKDGKDLKATVGTIQDSLINIVNARTDDAANAAIVVVEKTLLPVTRTLSNVANFVYESSDFVSCVSEGVGDFVGALVHDAISYVWHIGGDWTPELEWARN